MNIIKKITIATLSIFFLITLYDLLLHGWFEQPSTNVSWWDAGAGSTTLIIRFALLAISAILSFIMIFAKQSIRHRLIWILAIPIVTVTFVYSTSGIERYAEGFDDAEFQDVIANLVDKNRTYSKKDILNLIGEPLVREDNDQRWCYSYMPSSGWGWTKRSLSFDDKGNVDSWSNFSEP